MSKIETISRYFVIIKKLRRYPVSFKEIMDELELESEIRSLDLTVSRRTFYRDLKDIDLIFRIYIQYNRSEDKYYIDFDEQDEMQERIFEAFDIFNAFNISNKLSQNVYFEKRIPQGTEHLYGILHAIKNNVQINFTYNDFIKDEIREKKVEPYALK